MGVTEPNYGHVGCSAALENEDTGLAKKRTMLDTLRKQALL